MVGHAVLFGKRVFLRSWYGLFCAPGPDSSATISAGTSSVRDKRKMVFNFLIKISNLARDRRKQNFCMEFQSIE